MSEGEIKIEPQLKKTPDYSGMSRRSFLKLSALLPLAAIPHETRPKDENLFIETPEGQYYPIYESHPHPAKAEQLRLLPPQDVFLYEYIENSRYFIDSPSHTVLDSAPETLKGLPDSEREYIVPRDHLALLRENRSKISFEGYELPSELGAVLPMLVEGTLGAGSASYLINNLLSKPKQKMESSKNHLSRRQFLKMAAGLAAAWGLSPTAFLLITPAEKTDVRLSALERTIIKAHGLSSHLHPNDSIIFFRNIMFARRLQFLGEAVSKEKEQKARIAYNVGKMHAGIEDFLQMGREWTLAFLNIIPNQYLQEVIDANGGLENFCTTVLFDPNTQNPTKTVLKDNELEIFLDRKLNLPEQT